MTSKLSHHALCVDVVYLKQKIVKTYSKQGAEMRSYVIGKHVFVLYHTRERLQISLLILSEFKQIT